MKKKGMSIIVNVVVLSALVVGSLGVDYSYVEQQVQEQHRGPSRWGEITSSTGQVAYATCKHGSTQSPIDIAQHHEQSSIGADFSPLQINSEAGVGSFTSSHDGAQLFFSEFTNVPTFYDAEGGRTAPLSKIYFRSPSDHSFGGGKRDFEIQLHFKESGSSSTSVVSITGMAHGFSTNRELHKVLDAIPAVPPLFEKANTKAVEDSTFNIKNLLPPSRQYGTYEGSLTFPPCTEQVRYYVLTEPIAISAEQLTNFRSKMGLRNTETTDFAYEGNSRPIQTQKSLQFFLDEDVNSNSYQIPSGDKTANSVILERSIAAVILAILGAALSLKSIAVMKQYASRRGDQIPSGSPDASVSAKYLKTN